jgi:cytochrome c oxidase subunit 4
MTERTISPPTYTGVCLVLVLLTVLTVAASFLHAPPVWHLVIGVTIAVVKATLVVLFFMHVLLSDKVTWSVVIIACFWLGILLVLSLSDYISRGLVPFMPGH